MDECKPLGGGGFSGGGGGGSGGGGGGGGGGGDGHHLTEEERQSEDPPPEPRGRAVQVDPVTSTLKAPGSKRLKLKCDDPLSSVGFKFNLRRYNAGRARSTPTIR